MNQPAFGSRALFPELSSSVYLNHAAISPPSTLVREAMRGCLLDYATLGVGAAMPWFEARDALRGEFAKLIGAPSPLETIALMPNTTAGIIACARSIDWREGDCIVLVRGDFPSNVGPWKRVARDERLELIWVDLEQMADLQGDLSWLDEVLKSKQVRLVTTSAVAFQTGWRMPLAAIGELCARHGTELFVDAIQACGVVPIDVARDHISYLACGGHKWLMGVEGAGFLYVSEEALKRSMRDTMAGWLSYEEPFDFLMEGQGHLRYDKPVRESASFLEVGAMSAVGYAGVAASIEGLLSLGVEQIFEHVNGYLDELEGALISRVEVESVRARAREAQSGALCLKLHDHTIVLADFQERVAAHGVALSIPDGYIRMAPHWPNHRREIATIVGAFEDALGASR